MISLEFTGRNAPTVLANHVVSDRDIVVSEVIAIGICVFRFFYEIFR